MDRVEADPRGRKEGLKAKARSEWNATTTSELVATETNAVCKRVFEDLLSLRN